MAETLLQDAFQSVFALPDHFNQLTEIFRIHIPYIAYAESIRLRNLARINHEPSFFKLSIKRLEIKIYIWIKKRSDDRRLNGIFK